MPGYSHFEFGVGFLLSASFVRTDPHALRSPAPNTFSAAVRSRAIGQFPHVRIECVLSLGLLASPTPFPVAFHAGSMSVAKKLLRL